jgi:magnesium-transporting ATPase (P-type)
MPPPGYVPPYAGPFYPRPPRNPRQNAAIAAGTMILIAGLFCLVFSDVILYWEGFGLDFDPDSGDEVRTINTIPFTVGLLLGIGFGLAVISAYACLRQIQFRLALVGPVTMIAAYISLIFYEPFVLVIMAYIFILSIISVFLIWYSKPIFDTSTGTDDLEVREIRRPAMPPGLRRNR